MGGVIVARKLGVHETRCEKGEFSVADQVIAHSSTWTQTIPLGRSDYLQGQVVLYVPQSVLYTYNRRMTIFVMIGTALNDAIARASGWTISSVHLYTYTDQWLKGYLYEDDTALSSYFYQAGAGRRVLLESARINGGHIELVWANTWTSGSAYLTCKGRFHVYR